MLYSSIYTKGLRQNIWPRLLARSKSFHSWEVCFSANNWHISRKLFRLFGPHHTQFNKTRALFWLMVRAYCFCPPGLFVCAQRVWDVIWDGAVVKSSPAPGALTLGNPNGWHFDPHDGSRLCSLQTAKLCTINKVCVYVCSQMCSLISHYIYIYALYLILMHICLCIYPAAGLGI